MLRPILRGLLVFVAANVVALGAGQLVAIVLAWQALVSLDLTVEGLASWGVAIVAALLVAAVAHTGVARSVGARIASAALALACAVAVGWTIAFYERDSLWMSCAPLVPAIVLGAWMAARPPAVVVLGAGARAAIVAMTLVALAAWGHVTIADAWEEYREQRLPERTIELVAAYPYDLEPPPGGMPSVVVDREGRIGDVVELDGQRFNLHRSDALRIPSSDVRRIRWIEVDGSALVSIRLGGASRERFEERTRHRMSQYDAVLVDGVPAIAFFYIGDDRLVLWHTERRALRAVYTQLTGETPAR